MENFFDRDLLTEPARTISPAPQPRPLTADDVRAMMADILSTLAAAEAMPFSPDELKRHRAMFPIMAQWLSPAEGERLVGRFESELHRLAGSPG